MEKTDEFDSGQDSWRQPEKRHTPLDSLVSLSQCIAQLRHQVNGLSSLQKRRKQRSSSVLSSPGSSAIDSQSLILDDSPKFLNCDDDSCESLGRQLEEARYQISLLKEGNVELAAELGETKANLNTATRREEELADRNCALEEEVKNMEVLLREKDSRMQELLNAQRAQEEPPRSPRCCPVTTQSARARLVRADADQGEMGAAGVSDARLGDPWAGVDSAVEEKDGFESGSTSASDRTSDSGIQISDEVPYEAVARGNLKADAVDQCGLEEVAELKRMIIERDMELDEMQEENERLKAHVEDLVDDLDVKKAEVYYLEEQVMRFTEGGNDTQQDSSGLENTKGVGMTCDGEIDCEDETPVDVGVGSRHITVVRRPSDACSLVIKKLDTGFNEVSYAEFSGGTARLDTQKQRKVFSGEANGGASYRAADQSDDSQSESCASEDCEVKADVEGEEDTSSGTSSACSSQCSEQDSKSGPACQTLKHSVLRFHHLCVKVGCKMNECVDSVDHLVEYTKNHPCDKPHISDSVQENISELSELNGLFYKNWALLRPMLLDFIEGMDTDNADKHTGKPAELLSSSSSSDEEIDDAATQEDADSASEIEAEEDDHPGKCKAVSSSHGLTDELDGIDLPCASNPIPAWQKPPEVPNLDLSRVILAGVNTRIGENDKLVPAAPPSPASAEEKQGEAAGCSVPAEQKIVKVDWVIRNGVKVDANVAKIEQLKYENQLILHDYNNVVREKDHIAADLEAARFDICVLQNEVFRKDEEKRFMCGQLHQVRMENVKVTSVVEELEVRNNQLNENCVRITAENGTLKICKEVLTTELDDARKSTHKAKRTIDQLSKEIQHLKANATRSRNDMMAANSHVEAIREALGRTECEKRTILQQLEEKNRLYGEARDVIEAQTLENRRLASELNRIQNSTGAPRGRRGHYEKRGGRGNGNFKNRC
ncbi:hypothetical protein BSKO_01753 [Bryopsis sp. KO-2023]|nr:hypothetical protein BSKO_01753 [Bryopsis sp. KO-2023]